MNIVDKFEDLYIKFLTSPNYENAKAADLAKEVLVQKASSELVTALEVCLEHYASDDEPSEYFDEKYTNVLRELHQAVQ